VRKYDPDGRTAWVRAYGRGGRTIAPSDGNLVDADDVTPTDVAVASDGRVFVAGPHIVANPSSSDPYAGDLAWDLRCWDAEGVALWARDLRALKDPNAPFESSEPAPVEMHVDAADNVYVMMNWTHFVHSGANAQHSQVLKFTKDGELLLNDHAVELPPFTAGMRVYDHLAVSASGAWTRAPNFTFNNLPWFEINDIAIVADAVAVCAGRLPGYLWGVLTLNELPLSVLNAVLDTAINSARFALGVAANEAGLMVATDGPSSGVTLNRLSQWNVSATDIGDITWQHACRPLGPVAMNWSQSRSAVLLEGDFFENNTDLHWPSIACLDVAGNVLWAHFHHNRTRVAIGNDGSVATIGPVAELGDREWEGMGGLVGV
jgi:hypothetical protein